MYNLFLNKLSFQRDDRFLFRNITFTAQMGDIVQLAGKNGSGKTTLMKIIVGLIEPSEGEVVWRPSDSRDKQTSSGPDTSFVDNDLCHSLLYLGHDSGVKLSLTALENLRWYFGVNGKKIPGSESLDNGPHSGGDTGAELNDKALIEALEWAGLRSYENVVCHEMSAGQRRRVALARLFISRAALWVLDEPFTAIDTAGVIQLENQIAQHSARGGIVLITTHQTSALNNVKLLDLSDFKKQREDIAHTPKPAGSR